MYKNRKPRCSLVGKKFSFLEVVDWDGHNGKGKHFWTCLCKCGSVVFVVTDKLKSGNTKSCGCYRASIPRKKFYTGCGELNGTLWGRITQQATRRNISINITKEDAWDIYLRQKGNCAISGLPIAFLSRRKGKNTASLDRIDNSKGYEIDNVWWVHKDVNIMKNVYNIDYFLTLCRMISEKHSESICDKKC